MFNCKIYPHCFAPTAPPLWNRSLLVRGKLPENKPHPSTVSKDSLLFQSARAHTHTRVRAHAHTAQARLHTHTYTTLSWELHGEDKALRKTELVFLIRTERMTEHHTSDLFWKTLDFGHDSVHTDKGIFNI